MSRVEYDLTDPDNPIIEVDGKRISGLSDEAIRKARQMAQSDGARDYVNAQRARREFQPPVVAPSLREEFGRPPPERIYVVEGLLPSGGNLVLIAGFKTGKTTLAFNFAKARVDGEPFMSRFAVAPPEGSVGIWNYELAGHTLTRWARDMEIGHPERISAVHWKDQPQRADLSAPVWQEWAVRWLVEHNVTTWMIDPVAVAFARFGEENDNSAVARFTDTLDQIKHRAGVNELIVTAHTGRERPDEGQERARGATRWEDWGDALWYLTADRSGTRYLRAIGRDVSLDATELSYDEPRRRFFTHGRTREESRTDDAMLRVVRAVSALGDGAATEQVKEAMGGAKSGPFGRDRAVVVAEQDGFITRTQDGHAKTCSLTQRGRDLASRGYEAKPPTPSGPPKTPGASR